MMLGFTHKGLEKFYSTGSKAGIQAKYVDKLCCILSYLWCCKLRWWFGFACIPFAWMKRFSQRYLVDHCSS